MIKWLKKVAAGIRLAIFIWRQQRAPETQRSVPALPEREHIDGPLSHRAPPVSNRDPAGGA